MGVDWHCIGHDSGQLRRKTGVSRLLLDGKAAYWVDWGGLFGTNVIFEHLVLFQPAQKIPLHGVHSLQRTLPVLIPDQVEFLVLRHRPHNCLFLLLCRRDY